MKYNFDNIAPRKNTNSYKYDMVDACLPMWVADMDFPIAEPIKKAVQKDLNIGALGYSFVPDSFYHAIIRFYEKRYQTNFQQKEMVYVSGVIAGLDSLLKELCQKGDNVVMLSPIYHTFFHCIENNGLNPLCSQLIYQDHQYQIDFIDLEEKLKRKESTIFLLCNPHNPVGKIFNEEELLKIEELCYQNHVFIISDEIHGLLTNPKEFYLPFVKIAKHQNNYAILISASKAFNLAGLQSACLICPNEKLLAKFAANFMKDDIGEPNFFAVNANIAAFTECEDWLDEVNEYVYQNKLYLSNFLLNYVPEIYPILTSATYMMWLDISTFSKDSRGFNEKLKKETGLYLSPGYQFGPGGEGFMRINLATSLDNVKKACEKLKTFLEKFR